MEGISSLQPWSINWTEREMWIDGLLAFLKGNCTRLFYYYRGDGDVKRSQFDFLFWNIVGMQEKRRKKVIKWSQKGRWAQGYGRFLINSRAIFKIGIWIVRIIAKIDNFKSKNILKKSIENVSKFDKISPFCFPNFHE